MTLLGLLICSRLLQRSRSQSALGVVRGTPRHALIPCRNHQAAGTCTGLLDTTHTHTARSFSDTRSHPSCWQKGACPSPGACKFFLFWFFFCGCQPRARWVGASLELGGCQPRARSSQAFHLSRTCLSSCQSPSGTYRGGVKHGCKRTGQLPKRLLITKLWVPLTRRSIRLV